MADQRMGQASSCEDCDALSDLCARREAEIKRLRAALATAHDSAEKLARALVDAARGRSDKGAYDRSKRRRYQAAGSCNDCGAEATNGRTRCTPCGQRNARGTARRRDVQATKAGSL